MPSRDPSLTFFDRRGPDGALDIRSAVLGLLLGAIATFLVLAVSLLPPPPPHPFVRAFAIGITTAIVGSIGLRRVADGAGATFLAFLFPSGRSTPAPREYSKLEALAAKGDLDGALAGFEAELRAAPGDSGVRLQAAELYVRAGNPHRAEALFREVQQLPARTDAHDLRASNRLVDLYLGPLAEPGRALRELRRIADTHAGTVVGDGALEAIARIKGADSGR